MAVIRFKTDNVDDIDIPYGHEMGGDVIADQPFTGNGFTKSTDGNIVPEYKIINDKRIDIKKGSELVQIISKTNLIGDTMRRNEGILSISPEYIYWMDYQKENEDFPYVTIINTTFTQEPDKELLADGWNAIGYDRYQDNYRYNKVIDIRENIKGIIIRFRKKTEERDFKEFGFTEEYMCGCYHYPVPVSLMDEIARIAYYNRGMSMIEREEILTDEIKSKITEIYGGNLIDDEFNALRQLKVKHLQALTSGIDCGLTEKEQKDVFTNISKSINNPSIDKYYEGRSHFVMNENLKKIMNN